MEFFALATVASALVTKLVDAVRYFDKDDSWPKIIWIALALGFGVAFALIYQADYLSSIEGLPPIFENVKGTGAQVLTGLAIGAYASGLHELFDALSGVAKRPR